MVAHGFQGAKRLFYCILSRMLLPCLALKEKTLKTTTDELVCMPEWSHQTHKWVYPTIEPKNDPNGARGAEIWLLKVGRYRSQNCVFTVISPTFDQPYLSAACSVWGVLRLNRGSRKLTWVMASTPPAGRARARRYGAVTSHMSPRDTRGT